MPIVSAGIAWDLTTDYFTLVELTFVNPTDQWIGVTSVELVPDAGAPGPDAVVAGEDLVAWGAAMERITRINEANQAAGYTTASLVFAGVAALGAGLGSRPVAAIGAAGLVASEVGGVASGVARTVREGERVLMLPQAHLLAGAFRVPPGLHADRWVLFNTKRRPRGLQLKIGWSDGTASTLAIDLTSELRGNRAPTVLAP